MNFPTLYHKGRAGKLYSWRVWTEGESVKTEYGTVDGAKQFAVYQATGKNIGKSNETTAEQQAEVEAVAMFSNRCERKYSLTPLLAAAELFLPMLAHDFEKRKSKVTYGVSVQPKLDGVRCLASAEGLFSRQGKRLNLPHIEKHLAYLPVDTVLDGEIYIHGASFQEIVSLVKKNRPESARLQYHVYDCPRVLGREHTWEFRERILSRPPAQLQEFLSSESIRRVEARWAQCEGEVYSLQSEFCLQGFEGAIVRTMGGRYEWGHRSPGLLKVKSFRDDDFEIVGFSAGVGRESDCVIWECQTAAGKTFQVRPRGTLGERRTWLTEARTIGVPVGSRLKVKYFELTEDGVPRFPVGLGIRLEVD